MKDNIEFLLAATPNGDGSLHRGQPQHFNVTLRYTLVSRRHAKLSLSLAQFQNPESCVVSPGEYIAADEIDVQRGTGTVTLPITWPGDTGIGSKGRVFGYGSVSFATALWKDHLQDRFYSTEYGRRYCLRFGVDEQGSAQQ